MQKASFKKKENKVKIYKAIVVQKVLNYKYVFKNTFSADGRGKNV